MTSVKSNFSKPLVCIIIVLTGLIIPGSFGNSSDNSTSSVINEGEEVIEIVMNETMLLQSIDPKNVSFYLYSDPE